MENGGGGFGLYEIVIGVLFSVLEGFFFFLFKIILDKCKDLSNTIDAMRKTLNEHGEQIGYLKGRCNGKQT